MIHPALGLSEVDRSTHIKARCALKYSFKQIIAGKSNQNRFNPVSPLTIIGQYYMIMNNTE